MFSCTTNTQTPLCFPRTHKPAGGGLAAATNRHRQAQSGRPDVCIRHEPGVTILKNLTPHDVVIVGDHGRLVIPPVATPARIGERRAPGAPIATQDGHTIDTIVATPGEITDLPEPIPGVIYVVSRLVAEHRPDRHDLVFPADLVRNGDGAIVACRLLARIGGSAHPHHELRLPTDV